MEIHITDNMNPYDTFDYTAYDQDQSRELSKPKKKVAFRDILSNMNLVVNKQGVLQKIQIMPQIQESGDDESYMEEDYLPAQPQITSEPPSVKHSYIYNKYFKDYVSQQIERPNVRVPKSIEEYHQMLREDQQKMAEERARVEQFKSRKLMFTCNPGHTESKDPRQIQTSSRHLRTMRFT